MSDDFGLSGGTGDGDTKPYPSGGLSLPPLHLPLRGSNPVGGGREEESEGGEVAPTDTQNYLQHVLEPSALQTYRDLLLDPDPKVRRQAASDIMEMRGVKGKVGPNLGGITFNLAPDRAQKLLEGLSKVFTKPKDFIDV